jgi:hypothetical protein
VAEISSFCDAEVRLDSDACITHIQYRLRSLSAFLEDVCDRSTFDIFVRKLADTIEADSRGLNGELAMKRAGFSIYEFLHSSLGALPELTSDATAEAVWHDFAQMFFEGYTEISS